MQIRRGTSIATKKNNIKKRVLGNPSPEDTLRTWIEIDTKAITHNFKLFRKFLGRKTKILAVVKSNAYGHNITEFSKELVSLGVDWLGVDSLMEAFAIREEKIRTPILVLGHTLPSMFEEARKDDIAITISGFDALSLVYCSTKSRKPLRAHIKVDTGMHRQGFQLHDLPKLITFLLEHKNNKAVMIEGLYTHFAEAKNPRSGDSTRRQIDELHVWVDAFTRAGFSPTVHASATAGTLLYPQAHFDMVRIGIGMYGLWPSSDVERFFEHRKEKLKPALSWKAVVSEVKDVRKGERVGYDFTELLSRDTTLAIIPVGYWYGLPRALSSKGRVLIHGKTARILGRVTMGMIMVDVTDIPKTKPGDIAVLIGKDGKEEIRAGELATFSGTTHYEIVTRLNPLMKRFYR